jgi:hypothetical protein
VPEILQFIDSGRDVMVATDHMASEAVRELAMECGVDFLDAPSQVTGLRAASQSTVESGLARGDSERPLNEAAQPKLRLLLEGGSSQGSGNK